MVFTSRILSNLGKIFFIRQALHGTGSDLDLHTFPRLICVCEVGTVGKMSDYQPEGPGFNPRPGRGLNFGRPSFTTPSVDRDVKPLVLSLNVLSGELKRTHTLVDRSRLMPVLWSVSPINED